MVGSSYGADGVGNAFAYYSGAMHSLPTLGGHVSEAFGVNSSGIVVGESTVPGDLDARAVEWSAGKVINLGTLGGRSSYALAINGSGQIAGTSQISTGAFHAFLDTNGVMHDIGTLPGYKNAIATGINSQGEVVGYAYNADTSQTHAWVYRNGVMTDLNKLAPTGTGWTLVDAPSINDNQQITGSAGGSNGGVYSDAIRPSSNFLCNWPGAWLGIAPAAQAGRETRANLRKLHLSHLPRFIVK